MDKCNELIICDNCHTHFMELRPLIDNIIFTSHFKKENPDFDEKIITDCSKENSEKMHKFEEKINGNFIFRALHNKKHIVYAINPKSHSLIFLRTFSNFKEYGKFLANKKLITETINNSNT